MAPLSLGRSSRRSPCREAGRGRAGCRHFHVHYHFPRQVSSLRLLPPSFFSLLSFVLLILPVLFLAVLALVVCFGWFTLVYFVSFLLRKCNGPHDQCVASDDRDDNDEACRNEKQDRNEEESGGSAMAEVCIIEGQQQIKEVFVDEFSNASQLDMSSRMASAASPYDCSRDEERRSSCEKLVEEVMAVFEINCKDLNEISYYLDVSSSEKEQIQDTPVNSFDEEIGGRELGTSNLVHLQADQESVVANIKEASAYADDAEILELIDKHETGAAVEIYSDDSAENDVECRTDLPDDFFAKKLLPEDFVDEQQQDTQNTVTDRTTKRLRDDHFIEEKGKQRFGSLDGHEKELAEDNWARSSDSTSLDCDFGENHQGVIEDISVPSTEDNIVHEMASGESYSVIDRVEDEDEISTSTSEGGPHRRLPLIRRSQPPWWNLCGVLDVFAGCQD